MFSNQSQEQIQKLVAEFNKLSQEEKDIRLREAAGKGQKDDIEILIRCGANVDVKDNWEDTALLIAVKKGHTNIVKLLISAGADLAGMEFIGKHLNYCKY